uniref:Uncharacterized protein n=1 Tax=Acrobeloides nanus TaxID=290746 RepID=A0A914DCM5_9BILA
MRWRNVIFKWRPLLLIVAVIYTILIIPSWFSSSLDETKDEPRLAQGINPKLKLGRKSSNNSKLTIDHSAELM